MNSEAGSARNTIASKLLILADQGDRDTWAAARREGLGGSDVAAICGEHPFRRAIDVWADKLHPTESGPTVSGDMRDRVEMGQYLEPFVLNMYAGGLWRRDGGRRWVWRPPLVCRRDRLWQRGSADGLSLIAEGEVTAGYQPDVDACPDLGPPGGGWWDEVTEVKTHGYYGGMSYDDPYGDDPLPADKRIQTAWYADLWQIPRVSLAALIDTHRRRQWDVLVDPAFTADLLTIAEEWWQRHIVEGHQPDPDGSERYSRHLRQRFPSDDGMSAKAGPELDKVVADYRAARAAVKAAETERDRLEQVIQASMGAHSVLETHLGKITWKVQTGRVKLRQAIDEVYRSAGWSPRSIMEHEDKHRGEGPRVFLAPQAWSRAK